VGRAVAVAAEHHGGVDVLVCSAGTAAEGSFLDTTVDSWRQVMSTNLDGMFLVSQAVARHQVALGRPGSIVTIGSMDSFGIDGPYSSYHTSKHAVLGLTRAMAVELGPLGIRANCVAPGFTHTEFDEWPERVLDHLLHHFTRAPLRRMAEPEEVAAAVLFLASDEASAITGSTLVVDSGLMASLHGVDSLPFESRRGR
jgi:NAD(P)-dependent dehydrogenase (short-subunit alcohol dehydrogenase family)